MTHYTIGGSILCRTSRVAAILAKDEMIPCMGGYAAPFTPWAPDLCPACREVMRDEADDAERDAREEWLASECRVTIYATQAPCFGEGGPESDAYPQCERDEVTDFAGAVSALRECVELSRYPVRSPEDCRRTWAISDEEVSRATGETTVRTVRVTREDGRPLPDEDLYRLYREAGLISR